MTTHDENLAWLQQEFDLSVLRFPGRKEFEFRCEWDPGDMYEIACLAFEAANPDYRAYAFLHLCAEWEIRVELKRQ